MDKNEYHIGDCVYIEEDQSQPYLIGKIEELQKISNEVGTVCKVTCFYRRRDLPLHVLKDADNNIKAKPKSLLLSSSKNHQIDTTTEIEPSENIAQAKYNAMNVDEPYKDFFAGLPQGAISLSAEDLHSLQQHQLFMSRQSEILPAKNIRGKCSVVFLSDIDTPEMYLKNIDHYFYSLIYDKTTETLQSDKHTVKIGKDHQAVIHEPNSIILKKLTEERKRKGYAANVFENGDDEPMPKKLPPPSVNNVPVLPGGRETLIFHPHHNLQNSEIDQYLILSKAVGTFARAFDVPTVTKVPTLHVAAAAASRDTTLLHALSLLHQSDYDIGKASQYLVPPVKLYKNETEHILDSPAPLICRDELENWSPAEANIFAEALEKCNKDFYEIRQNYLPWKSSKDIIEYYYMYKTSDRYAQQRKPKKDSLQQGHMKHVYILPYTKPSSSLITDLSNIIGTDKITSLIPCESCSCIESNNWYNWGPAEQKMRLCQNCWNAWKKNGGLKRPHESDRYHFQPFANAIKPAAIDFFQQPKSSNPVSIYGINGQPVPSAYIPIIVSPCHSSTSTSSSTRTSKLFYFRSTILYKLAQKLAKKEIYDPRKLARNPFRELDVRSLMDNLFDRDPVSLIHEIRNNYGATNISPSFIELIAKHCRSSITAASHC